MDSAKPRVVFLSAAPPWGSSRHRQHELAEQLGREFDVLYVERPTLQGSRRVVTERVADGVELYRPWGPFPIARVAPPLNWVARVIEARALQDWIGGHPSVVWIDEDLSANVARRLRADLTVYDAVDEDWTFTRKWNRWNLRRQKQLALEVCSLGLAASRQLAEGLGRPGDRDPVVLPNACDPEIFSPEGEVSPEIERIRSSGLPVLGFIGRASARSLDLELIEDLASIDPPAQIVFLGPIEDEVRDRLDELANVHLLGERPYEEVPSYVRGFDVGLIPYRVGGLIDYVFPKKAFEYMAARRPVVATSMIELRDMGDVIRIAADRPSFLAAVRDALAGGPDTDRRIDLGSALAQENSWDSRGSQARALLHEGLETAA